MQTIPGYSVTSELQRGRYTVHLQCESDGKSVVLKLLKEPFPSPNALARLRHECELLQGLDADSVVGAGQIKSYGDYVGVELEDLGAVSLGQALKQKGPGLGDLERALEVSMQLAQILDGIHQQNVIHKNISPGSILIVPGTGAVKLIDFSIATQIASEATNLFGVIEGTPEYMSPEQTGRMNRSLDHRSDLYSLGGTLYKLFTGEAPFENFEDHLSLVHAHIARTPISPKMVRPEIPQALSQIIMQLLKKDPEQRYQNALSLQMDLKQCLSELQDTGSIQSFPLRCEELTGRLLIPEKLFGRNEEFELLVSLYKRASKGGVELVEVRGPGGIGKSRLVAELEHHVRLANGYFVTSKADQYFSDQPYGSFLQALRTLVQGLLSENEAELNELCENLRLKLGPNGQLITDVVPELELLIGEQPPVVPTGPDEARNRFQRTFLQFIGVLARPQAPLVLFLDDLQWADNSSIDMLGVLARSHELENLMIVLAYRDNEVDSAHSLSLALSELANEGTAVAVVDLQPLAHEHVQELVEASLRDQGEEVMGLVDLIHSKTNGNPFFITQFLTALHVDDLLTFDHDTHHWNWRVEDIQARDYTLNVVEFVADKIHGLPPSCEHLLKISACLGSDIDLDQLAHFRGASRVTVAEELWPALEQKLLLPLTANYFLIRYEDLDVRGDGEASSESSESNTRFTFLHDRIKQAAYAMLDDTERREIHLQIGRYLRAKGDLEGQDLFELVNHLNLAIPLITDPQERRDLAELDLIAGRQARSAAAFRPALALFEFGVLLMADDAWDQDYELCLDLHLACAEAAYLTRDFERMTEIGELVLSHARDLEAEVRMREIQIRAWIAQDRRIEAIELALPLLQRLGATVPSEPKPEDYGAAFGATEEALAGREVASLADLPDMTESNALAAMRILSLIFSATYFAAPHLLPLVISKMVELSARNGNSQESAFGYVLFALHLCAFANDIERGYAFGLLAEEVLNRTDSRALEARTLFIKSICVSHWKEPISATVKPLMFAHQSGLDTGDIEYATHSLMISNQHLLAIGHNLPALHERMKSQRSAIEASKEDAALSLFAIYQQVIANLLGNSEDPVVLTGEHHDELKMLAQHEQTGDRTSLFHIHFNKAYLAYIFGRFDEARTLAEQTRGLLDSAVGVFQIPLFHALESLILLSVGQVGDEERKRITENQEQVWKWAQHCKANNQHRWHLVEAELARRDGNVEQAMQQYQLAAELAREHNYPQEEALINERFGRFWSGLGNAEIASLYSTKAQSGYEVWGAHAKSEQFKHHFVVPSTDTFETTKPESELSELDLNTVIRASQILSREIRFQQLLESLLKITVENAGAQCGYLFLKDGEQWWLEGSLNFDGSTYQSNLQREAIALTENNASLDFSVAILRYVIRTKEPVVLDSATKSSPFEKDEYIRQTKALSILCTPLIQQGEMVAILYLENNLTTSAFTPERLEVLQVLVTQAAISLENSKLYTNLENKVLERTIELKNTLVDLEDKHKVLMDTQAQLVHSEKMASLGTLVSGVAHEINNPVNFVMQGGDNTKERLKEFNAFLHELAPDEPEVRAMFDDKIAPMYRSLDSLLEGGKRIHTIVNELKSFSRLGSSSREILSIVDGLKASISLAQTTFHTNINFQVELGSELILFCWPAQLNQVFMNVIVNACQAILSRQEQQPEHQGVVMIKSDEQEDWIEILFQDNGCGMTEEVKSKMFEPFFTTRTVGDGKGLGLSVSYGIIKDHDGDIEVTSTVNEGTQILLRLPKTSPTNDEQMQEYEPRTLLE